MTPSFYLETYGCSLNAADSDMIVGHLHQLGARRVERPEEADVVIVNTCGVKEPTEDKIVYRLSQLSHLPAALIVTGCLPKISLERVKYSVPDFAAIVGPQSIDTLGDIFRRVVEGERGIIHLESDTTSKLRFYEGPPNTVICTIPICEGCLGACTYCAVRLARSSLRSYTIDEILQVVRRVVHMGYREIRLTAQDAGAFGRDTGESLVTLLRTLDSIPGDHRFRLGMFNPDLVGDQLDELLDVMASPRFFKFFHIPLQSGSNRVLRLMGRRYMFEEWADIVRTIRARFPMATIATDIIVGFPGESARDFEDTLDAITRMRPQIVNISKYGDRPGTPAARSDNKVHTKTKKERSRTLSRIVERIVTEEHARWLGWRGDVLVTGEAPRGGMMARNQSYVPVIVHGNVPVGSLVEVKIVEAGRTHLVGHPRLST